MNPNMIMKKSIFKIAICLTALSWPLLSYAQDVIVKTDGTTIISKVLEVTPDCIKYKKHSNQQGPTYTVNITDVMAINYENGDKDTFNTTKQTNISSLETSVLDNKKQVEAFNRREPVYIGEKGKKAVAFIAVMGINEGSIIETSELKADFSMKRYITHATKPEFNCIREIGEKSGFGSGNNVLTESMMLVVALENKTNRTIYVDQGGSFLMFKSGARSLYTPKATTIAQSTSNGGSTGIGTAIGGISIGGNVGSSTTNSTTVTTYSQRIIAIPPMSMVALEIQDIGYSMKKKNSMFHFPLDSEILKNLTPALLQAGLVSDDGKNYKFEYQKLQIGQSIELSQTDKLLSLLISYSYDEDVKEPKSMRMDFNIRKIMGADDTGNGDRIDLTKMDLSQTPLLYIIRGKRLEK